MNKSLLTILCLFMLAACGRNADNAARSPEIHDSPGAPYETLFQIPVGENGIDYRGLDVPEMQVTGPNALAVAADGSFFISDLVDNLLLHYSTGGRLLKKIDLSLLGITNISDLVSTPTELYLLEISFHVAPERYRVSRLSFDGELVAQYDIPKGYHFEDGLYGLAAPGSQGEILLEFYGPVQWYYQLADLQGEHCRKVDGISAYGYVYQAEAGITPAIVVGDLKVESKMTLGGLLKILAVNPDGTFYVIREDMVSDLPVIQGDITIHFMSAEGEQLGAARYPLSEWMFFVQRYAAVSPDGNVYGLLPRHDTVDILRLNFYPRLEPLISDAVEPLITRVSEMTSLKSEYDCSAIQRVPSNSQEAQQIVEEFIANYRQDFPTEYMAIEQLWAVDKLGEYAAIQGRVTQEESDIVIVQQTERGFVMIARYHTHMVLAEPRRITIPQYFIEQLPKAPAELFHCLDLSRYVAGSDP